MKKNLTLIATIFLFAQTISSQQNNFIGGANISSYLPVGAFANRFENAFGGSFYFGKQLSEKWTWYGKVEYMKFDDLNKDKLVVKRTVLVGNVEAEFTIPLDQLRMNMEIFGVSANADINIFRSEMFEGNVNLGFGLFWWRNFREAFDDTLFVKDNSGNDLFADYIKVPELTQGEWSGGINAGANVGVKIFDPVWFTVGANFKAIIGELWSALALDLENVSTFQMFDARAGIKINF